jgi:hypothetical protein
MLSKVRNKIFLRQIYRKEKTIEKSKKGAVIFVGGDGNFNKAYDTACCLLHHMNAYDSLPAVNSHDTNNGPAVDDKAALTGVSEIVGFFNL